MSDEFPKVEVVSPAPLAIFSMQSKGEHIMINETSDNLSTMGSTIPGLNGTNVAAPNVQRVAQKAHEAVDKIEQTLSTSTEKVMGWQQEYGEMAREQVRANPLAVVAGAFAIGYLFAKISR